MCGFFSVSNTKKKITYSKEKLDNAANLLKHRGPDKKKTFNHPNLYCKFFRLKILDLSDRAMQPMTDINKNYVLMFNGEIYNFKELNKLYLLDKKFNYNSDTSTLFNMLIKYQENALKYLDGMFSFVFFDLKKKKIIFARDRFGIKPIYYQKKNDTIVFSSEIKPLISFFNSNEIDTKSTLNFFLKGSMDHNDKTFFKNISSLEAGEVGIFYKNKIKKRKYWNLINKNNINNDENKTLKDLEILFQKSIDKHLVSDRQIGLFLSGGTDSTALAHILTKKLSSNFSTFTYGFKNDKKFSEIDKAKITINNLKIDNTYFEISENYVQDNMEKMVSILESPFTSIRLFGVEAIYNFLKKTNIKVILEGDGGDELFGGYDYNFFPYLKGKYKNKNKLNNHIVDDLFNFTKLKKKSIKEQYQLFLNLIISNSYQYGSTSDGTPFVNIDLFNKDFLNSHIDESFFKDEFKKQTKRISDLKKSQYRDIYFIKLPRALKYKDRISMNYGIEARIPFLDHHFAQNSFNLDDKYKIKNFNTRYIFKKILKKISKNKIKFNKTKISIADPQSQWLSNGLKNYTFDNLNSSHFRNLDLFNHKKIKIEFEKFCAIKQNKTSFQIFQILTYINFYKYFKKYN